MRVEWRVDADKDWNLYVDDDYEGLLCNRFTEDGSYRMWLTVPHELGLADLEEAKAVAIALWALNR